MATVTPVFATVGRLDGSVILYTWALTTANADGAPISMPEWADRTWQAQGTWGSATFALQGSNDKVNWFPLTNAAGGTAVTLTADGGAATIELPLWVRPNLTTPGSGAAVNVSALFRRAQPQWN